MAKLRLTSTRSKENQLVERYKARDISNLAKKRLKMLKFTIYFIAASVILNIYQLLN